MSTTSGERLNQAGALAPPDALAVAGPAGPQRPRRSNVALRLLQSFELRVGPDIVVIPQHAQRVLAFLAVQGGLQLRSKVAFSLWADTTEGRARASLRTALWKVKGLDLLEVRGSYIGLSKAVDVDLHELIAQAKRLILTGGPVHARDADADGLVGDLLPDWEEDWLQFERERLRQLRLHALEALSSRLSASGRHAESIDAAQAAVAAEPLRESAQRILINAHLAEGNLFEARRQFEAFRALLWENLGHVPSRELREIMFAAAGARSDPGRADVHGVDDHEMTSPG